MCLTGWVTTLSYRCIVGLLQTNFHSWTSGAHGEEVDLHDASCEGNVAKSGDEEGMKILQSIGNVASC
jgi:hypothetical protein